MKTQSPEQAEVVMAHFNLTAETFNALPRGLAAELYSMVNSHDALVAACKAACEYLGKIPAFGDSIGSEVSKAQLGIAQNLCSKALDTINA